MGSAAKVVVAAAAAAAAEAAAAAAAGANTHKAIASKIGKKGFDRIWFSFEHSLIMSWLLPKTD